MTMEISYRLQRQEAPMKSIVYHPDVIDMMSNADQDTYSLTKTMNEKIEPILFNLLYHVGDMNEIMIYSENRKESFGNYIAPSLSVENSSWYWLMKENDNRYTTWWWYDKGKLFATRNIYDPDIKQVIGQLYVKFNFDKILGEVLSREIADHGVVIIDSQNRIIVSELRGQEALISNALQANSETIQISTADSKYMVVHESIPQTDWTLHYIIPKGQSTASTDNILSATGIIVLLCMVFLSFIIFLFSETFLKGIVRLNTKMKMVEEGNLNVVVTADSKDEIGQLTRRFGSMLTRINQLIDEVYQAKYIQKEAELKALQAQINPHFLYNTLSLINSKAIRMDAMEISHLVNQLSKFYRTTLNKGQQVISIQDEWTNILAYNHIQSAMHNNGFDIVYELDENVFQYDMIHLILQPIVENAIVHGIEQLREGRGRLVMKAYITGENIHFDIADNGVGIEKDGIERLLVQEGQGYGLKNVRDRLKLFFGEEYGLSIESSVGEGTTVAIIIPKYNHQKNKV